MQIKFFVLSLILFFPVSVQIDLTSQSSSKIRMIFDLLKKSQFEIQRLRFEEPFSGASEILLGRGVSRFLPCA
jgi:hypothetical protein